jgi:hypothetical protein
MFRGIVVHPAAMSSDRLGLLTFDDDSHHDFSEMSGATHPITMCHISEDLTLQVYLLCNHEFLSSRLNPQTSHPDRIFVIFQVLPGKLQDAAIKYATTASFHMLSHSFIH